MFMEFDVNFRFLDIFRSFHKYLQSLLRLKIVFFYEIMLILKSVIKPTFREYNFELVNFSKFWGA